MEGGEKLVTGVVDGIVFEVADGGASFGVAEANTTTDIGGSLEGVGQFKAPGIEECDGVDELLVSFRGELGEAIGHFDALNDATTNVEMAHIEESFSTC